MFVKSQSGMFVFLRQLGLGYPASRWPVILRHPRSRFYRRKPPLKQHELSVHRPSPMKIAVIGDSHARRLSVALRGLMSSLSIPNDVRFIGYGGCKLIAFQRGAHYHRRHGAVPDYYLQILEFNAHINIVWLCSNDFDLNPREYDIGFPTHVFNEFKVFMKNIQYVTGEWPVVLDILNRPAPSRGLTSKQYHKLAQRFNNQLQKKYKNRCRLHRELQDPVKFHWNFLQDGVHLTHNGYEVAACHVFQFVLRDLLME